MSNHPSHFSEPSEAAKDAYGEAFIDTVNEYLDEIYSTMVQRIASNAPRCSDSVLEIAEEDDDLFKDIIKRMHKLINKG